MDLHTAMGLLLTINFILCIAFSIQRIRMMKRGILFEELHMSKAMMMILTVGVFALIIECHSFIIGSGTFPIFNVYMGFIIFGFGGLALEIEGFYENWKVNKLHKVE